MGDLFWAGLEALVGLALIVGIIAGAVVLVSKALPVLSAWGVL